MAPTEEKCVCQICTCGKHRCRHCTEPPYDLHVDKNAVSELSEYRSQYLGLDVDLPRSAKRKQWEKSPEQTKKIYKSYPIIKEDKENRSSVASGSVAPSPLPSTRTESLDVRSDTASDVATTENLTTTEDSRLRDPLRNKPINTMPHDPLKDMTTEELLAQIARPIPVKPVDNLKPVGSMELITTHQHDFTEKSADRYQTKRPHTALRNGLYEDAYSGYSDSMTNERNFSVATTHDQSTLKQMADSSLASTDLMKAAHSDVSYAASDATTFDRSAFETSTITSQEGHESRREEHATVPSSKPLISGDFRTLDNHQSLMRAHERKKWDQSTIYRDTTLRHDFKNWEINRPLMKKPKDSLKNEGTMDLQTTTRSQFTAEKVVGRVKPQQMRPKTSFRLEGEFDGRTVNNEVYKGVAVEFIPRSKPPASHLYGGGQFQAETTTASDYKGWVIGRSHGDRKLHDDVKADHYHNLLPSITVDPKDHPSGSTPISDSLITRDKMSDAKQIQADYHSWATNGTSPYLSARISAGDDDGKATNEFSYNERPERLLSSKPDIDKGLKPSDAIFKEALESQDHPSARAVYVGPAAGEDMKMPGEEKATSSPSAKGDPSETKAGKTEKVSQESIVMERSKEMVEKSIKADNGKGAASDIPRGKDADAMKSDISEGNQRLSTSTNEIREGSSAISDRGQSAFYSSAKRDSKPEIELETTSRTHFKKWDIERPVPVKHKDNLRQSGKMEFQTTTTSEFPEKIKGDRPEQVRYYDNLKQEGEMKFETTNAVMFEGKKLEGRPKPIRHQDNIKQEGKMELVTSNVVDFSNVKPEARPEQVRYKDNLKQEGSMQLITTNSVEFPEKVPDPRFEPVKYKDNIVPEGELDLISTSRAAYADRKPEARPIQVRYKDNLKQEGSMEMITTNSLDFKERPLDPRPQPIRQKDNIIQEGDMQMVTTSIMEFPERLLDARPKPIRQKDNIKQEGNMYLVTTNLTEFPERPLDARPQPIRQKDNIKQEGDMQMITTNITEFPERLLDARPQPIRQKDNIKQEGDMQLITTNITEFPERLLDGRPQPIRQKDNIKQEGEMQMITTNITEFPERSLDARPQPIRQKDNIKQEGSMHLVTTNAVEFPERPVEGRQAQIRHKDHIKTEGKMELTTTNKTEFEMRNVDVRPSPIRQKDNLKLEGNLEMVTSQAIEFPERKLEDMLKPIRQKDNIKQEGEMEFKTTNQSEFGQIKPEDKPKPIRYKDNLKQEGSMELATTNRLEFPEKRGEGKLQSIRQKDNIKQEGVMTLQTTTASFFPERHLDARPQPVKYKDNLKSEGTMELVTSNKVEFPERKVQEKPTPVKYKDNIKIEGDMALQTTNAAEFPERKEIGRPLPVKHSDNIKQEGKMEMHTTTADMFPERRMDERPKPVRYKDNIKQEGTMELHTTNADMFRILKGERPKPVKYTDNLKYSGVLFSSKKSAHSKSKIEKSRKQGEKSVSKTGAIKTQHTENEANRAKQLEVIQESSNEGKPELSKEAIMKDDKERAIQVKPESTNEVSATSQGTVISSAKEEAAKVQQLVSEQKMADKQLSSIKEESSSEQKTSQVATKLESKHSGDAVKQILRENDAVTASKESKGMFDQSNKYFGISDAGISVPVSKSRQSNRNGQQSWIVVKPTTPVKRQDNLQLKGTIDFKTTNQSSYVGHYTPKVSRAKRPQSSLKIQYENGDGSLADRTFHSERKNRGVSKSHTNLASVSPTKTWKKEGSIRFTGDMDFNTTHRIAYNGLQSSRSESSLHKISERPKDTVANTTQLMRSTSHGLFGSQEPFSGATTYRCSFAAARPGGAMGRSRCPATEIEKDSSKYQFRKEVNGHKYYLPLVES